MCFAAFPKFFDQVVFYRLNTPVLRVHCIDESTSRAKQQHWLRLFAVLNINVHIYKGSNIHHVLYLWATDQSVNSTYPQKTSYYIHCS